MNSLTFPRMESTVGTIILVPCMVNSLIDNVRVSQSGSIKLGELCLSRTSLEVLNYTVGSYQKLLEEIAVGHASEWLIRICTAGHYASTS